MRELLVTPSDSGGRLDKYLGKYLDRAPKSFLYRMLRKKNITLNGKRAAGSEQLCDGDRICLYLAEDTIDGFRSEERRGAAERKAEAGTAKIPDVLYEDGDVVFFAKPAGLLTQSDRSGDLSLADLLLSYLAGSGHGSFGNFRPSPAHRLDRNTSGVVMCGKTLRGQQALSEAIRERTVRKFYLAAVYGCVKSGGRREISFRKDSASNRVVLTDEPGAERMITSYEAVCVSDGGETVIPVSLLSVELITGKPHQIRAHLAALGHPVLGDPKYGDPIVNRSMKGIGIRRQMLHAFRVTFPGDLPGLPGLSGLTVTAPLPDDMKHALNRLNLTEEKR